MDFTFVLSAAIFTLLALVIATSFFNSSSSKADSANSRRSSGQGSTGGLDQAEPKLNGHIPEMKEEKEATKEDWCDISAHHDHWDVVKSVQSTEGATEGQDIEDEEDFSEMDSLKYVPGKARSHHLEMMMSKEELEEEQRVQRDQLAAIFKLLKDNKETFGEVSEGDMEEQLRLYSI